MVMIMLIIIITMIIITLSQRLYYVHKILFVKFRFVMSVKRVLSPLNSINWRYLSVQDTKDNISI